MFRNLSKLHTPEWFKAFRPHELVDKLLFMLRVLLSKLSRIPDRFITYNNRIINKDYSVIVFPKNNIKYIPSDVYKYQVTGIDATYEILGYNVAEIAVKGMDYIVKDGIYFFKSNPTRYCQTYETSGEVWHRTIAVAGGETKVQQALQVNSPFDPVCCTNYDSMMRYSMNGISNLDALARQGISCRGTLTGKPVLIWKEKNIRCTITDTGSFICAPEQADIIMDYETPITVSNVAPSIFVVELNNKLYPVSSSVNVVDNYPNIKDIYNTLPTYGDKFFGIDLLHILKNQGCNFTEIGYIKQEDNGGNICQYGRYITRLPNIVIEDNLSSDCVVSVCTPITNLNVSTDIGININVKYL